MSQQVFSKDITKTLDYLIERPGLFILNQNLDYLFNWISGFQFALWNDSENELNQKAMDNFSKFVQAKFNEENENSFGWYGYIRDEFGGKKKDLRNFVNYIRSTKMKIFKFINIVIVTSITACNKNKPKTIQPTKGKIPKQLLLNRHKV